MQPANHALLSSHAIENRAASSDFVIKIALFRDSLEKGDEGDEWFIERIRNGATINGITRMPAFEGTLSQEAMWAIRTYVESKYEE